MDYYAIDFGTSNSLINFISSEGEITPVPMEGNDNFILRSLIFTPEHKEWYFGESAIIKYTENDGEGRFLRSIKKFLPASSYTGTVIHNKNYSIESIVALFLKEMKEKADKFIGKNITNVIMGRPAKYSLDQESDLLAENRMRKACALAGFTTIHFCPEPLAAGLNFSQGNTKKETILIADFGGGTSDFTLMQLHEGKYSQDDILGISGIFKAGDTLDSEMMLKFISKNFGADYEFKLPMSDKILRFPRALLRKICSPAHITHLREKETWNYLKEIHQFANDEKSKKQLHQLFALVEYQLGYTIFQEIENSKISICSTDADPHLFRFSHGVINISENIYKEKYDFEMGSVVDDIIATMMDVFEQSNLKPSDVDKVVLTGGTAQFTLIKSRLKKIFGEEKLTEHNIYQSVVEGLSQYANFLKEQNK